MKVSRILAATAVAFLVAAAAPPADDTEALLRRAHAAFARGDWRTAAEFYDQASLRATDPVPPTLYLAAARYHQAATTGAPGEALREAEALYRSCVDSPGPQRLEALCGLGNCLVLRGKGDAAVLREALRCFEVCCKEGDGALRATAAHNREEARLLLLQVTPPTENPGDDTPPNDTMPRGPQPPPGAEDRNPTEPGRDERPGGTQKPQPVKPEPGSAPKPTDQQPPPGAGNLPPVPDRPDLPPLSAQDAAKHLEAAHERIVRERQSHRRRIARPPSEDIPGW
jgi:hypothetical protein